MSTMQVAATTVTNISGTSRKFYTIHVIDNLEIRQYGRIGTQGQFQHIHHPGKRTAEKSAESQITAKERKGYGNRQNTVYALDDRYMRYDKNDLSKIVHQAHLAAQQGGGFEPGRDALDDLDDLLGVGQVENDLPDFQAATAFDSFNERALRVIGTAASGSTEAATTYATLREEFEGMEEGFERCKSMLETLEIMLTNEVTA